MNDDDFLNGFFNAQRRFVFYKDERCYKLQPPFIISADIFIRFPCFGILKFQGCEDSGKSNSIKMLAGTAVNYKYLGRYTGASLRNWIDHDPYQTYFLDEQKHIFPDDILTLLRLGCYKTGGKIETAAAGKSGKWVSYNVYCPKVMSTYNAFEDRALESRCITIFTTPTEVDRDICELTTWRHEATPLRKLMENFERRYKDEIFSIYSTLKVPELGYSRLADIYKPLLAASIVLDRVYPNQDFYKSVLSYGIDQYKRTKAEKLLLNKDIGFAEAILEYIDNNSPHVNGVFYRIDIITKFLIDKGVVHPFTITDSIGRKIRKLGVVSEADRPRIDKEGNQATAVVFNRSRLMTVAQKTQGHVLDFGERSELQVPIQDDSQTNNE